MVGAIINVDGGGNARELTQLRGEAGHRLGRGKPCGWDARAIDDLDVLASALDLAGARSVVRAGY